MKTRSIKIFILIVIFGLNFAGTTQARSEKEDQNSIKLIECVDKTLGYKLLCSKEWPVDRTQNNITTQF